MILAGLYIHIPFCKQACYYCDFHFSTNPTYRSQLVDCIAREIAIQKTFLDHELISTIYFGGGTPSIIGAEDLHKIMASIYQNFKIDSSPEITLEANPDDLSAEKLRDLKKLGINRLSIGVQSFNDKTLSFLHRAHDSTEAINSIRNARKAGFNNISIDLIFSIPGQKMDELDGDIKQVLELNPEHVSVYSLTIEEKTVFGNWHKKGKFRLVSDDKSAKQFDLIISRLEDNDFEQYEISNFCRDRNYSRHNTSYWKNIKYLGVGPGAHSYNGVSRQFNLSNNHKYMKSIYEGAPVYEIDQLSEKDRLNELLLTSLRTKWGCDLINLKKRFNVDILEIHHEKIDYLQNQSLVYLEGNFLYLTRRGRFVADEIISDLFIL